jgi:MoaA/NifB/PqqE/SkfB family radical SAM enzyme
LKLIWPNKIPEPELITNGFVQNLIGSAGKFNLLGFCELFWAIRREEGAIKSEAIVQGNSTYPILVSDSFEVLKYSVTVFEVSGLEAFDRILGEVYSLKDLWRERFHKKNSHLPCVKNTDLPLVNLFEEGSDHIKVICVAPDRSCNFRCAYCFNHDFNFNKNRKAMDCWEETIQAIVSKIQRPLHMLMGSAGEPLYQKQWIKVARSVYGNPKVRRMSFVSNLSANPISVLNIDNAETLGVVGTLHPSQMTDFDVQFEAFLENVLSLKEAGASIAVNFVLTPNQLELYDTLRRRLDEYGVDMICNLLRGNFEGKFYPRDYTEEELALARRCHDRTQWMWDFQSYENNPYGRECVSGRYGFNVDFDGTVLNCDFARNRLGSIFDEALWVRSRNSFCTSNVCECQPKIGMISDFAKTFKMQGNFHSFDRRSHTIDADDANPLL